MDLLARENELIQKSNEIRDRVDDYTYTYNGKEYTSREIYDIYAVDYELYDLLNEGLNKEINDDLGQVYVELLDVRDKIAELNRYENYSLYADCELYNRDYTVDDLNKFKEDDLNKFKEVVKNMVLILFIIITIVLIITI